TSIMRWDNEPAMHFVARNMPTDLDEIEPTTPASLNASSAAVSAKLRCRDTLPLRIPQFPVRILPISNTRCAAGVAPESENPGLRDAGTTYGRGFPCPHELGNKRHGEHPGEADHYSCSAALDRFGRVLNSPRRAGAALLA